ncbi:MAG: cell division protein FtsX [Paracoccaceae bacterium]
MRRTWIFDVIARLRPDPNAGRIVPPTGYTANLTVFAAAAMAFLAVFAMALSLAAGRLAQRWGDELASGATVRIVAPLEQQSAQVEATLRVLQTTRGVDSARALSAQEQAALLAPWFGQGLDLTDLPVPRLIEVIEDRTGFDATGLRLRLAAEAPGAILDDHARWRDPLTRAASGLRLLGWLCIALILAATAAMISLAAGAALSANAQVISVLRLVGATDAYIADAFVRRFTSRASVGATGGTFAGMMAVLLLPSAGETSSLLTGLSFSGWHWILPIFVPILAGLVAFAATRAAAKRTLEGLT